ncbi:Ig-like domain repeat protein [Methanobrevibacter sp.]|uniref:Ig-like domain repeat protein n=1 Tax=Methanobrevibacter sp. TaxID=66852 RepID=UPI0026DF2D83|nr:Ig-like domain repeat protein [Methanobrevibacter sp.]
MFFSVLSSSSATDIADNATLVGVDDNQDNLQATDTQEEILTDSPDTFAQLDEVINDPTISQGDVINLTTNYTYADTDSGTAGVQISKSITVDGNEHTLDASNKSSIFEIKGNSHVILKNLNFINGNASDGGAIKVESGSSIELINCTFSNNHAENGGGAIFINGDSLTSNSLIMDSTFTDNTAKNGGAIYVKGSTLNISSSNFVGNNATEYAGSIFMDGVLHITQTTFENGQASSGGALELMNSNKKFSTIENSTFKNFYVSGDGGACYIAADNVHVKDLIFEDNVAGDDGGALYWEGSNGIIYNITCINNKGISLDKNETDTSSTRGGTICLTGANVTVSKSRFVSSSAYMDADKDSSKVDGGALFVTGNNVTIEDTLFSDCNATNNGGALYVIGNSTKILNCTFEDNNGLDGGALYVEGDECKLADSTFGDNTADDDGGAIFWEGSNGVIYNITCINNKGISKTKPDGVNTSSTRGGSISLIGDNVTLSKSTFNSSKAYIDSGKDSSKVDGGALFITGNNIIINETEFYDCTAVNNGGAIYIIGNSTRILNCSIDKTQAYIGGAIFIAGDDTTVDDSLFRHNTASGYSSDGVLGGSGGAIYVQGEGATVSNSDFAYGTSVNYGGAITVWGANANITKNVFDNCTATLYDGGSIFVNGANTTISLSNFTRSKANNNFAHGGAIGVSGNDANILGCNFDDCYAYNGGVIHISGSNALINNSDFKHTSTFNNRNTPYDGGAIYVDGTYTTVLNSNFTGFKSKDCGGAIYIRGENTLIKGSVFDDSNAVDGGAIYAFGNYAKIEDSAFNSSYANYGGAIYLYSWGASIKNASIVECSATYSGGAIYVAGGGTNIAESNFTDCLAEGSSTSYGGGAIYIEGPDTHISTSDFNNNKVYDSAYGGTIYIKGDRTFIDTSKFNSSFAKRGGVIYIEGERTIIDSSTFENSSSSSFGGAIAISGHNATVEGSSFDNIYANDNGGAIYVDGENTNILRSSFDKCVAKGTHSGGAIYIDDIKTTVAYSNFTSCNADSAGAININGINTQILYCNLNNNSAGSAGAIKVFGNDTIISNSNFTNNNATYTDGGALDIGGSNASVYSCWFDHNDAVRYGGAINWKGGHGDDTILGSTFTNNGCHGTGQGGGAIFWTSGDDMDNIPPGGLILNSIFINNTAYGHHGGAIDWYYARDSTINNCLFVNNTANSDGGALYIGDQNGHGHHLMMSNNQFYNNSAGKHGGAIANQMSDSWIYNNTFDGNKAKASGGTLLMKEGNADNSVIDHCYIYNSFIDQNYAGNTRFGVGGAAIRLGEGDNNITISNCAIINSTANKTWGGAIAIDSKSEHNSLINVTIQNAKVLDGYGGAIYWKGSYGTMYNVTIVNSSSTTLNDAVAYGSDKSANGGAIYLNAFYCNLDLIKIFESSSNNNNETCTKESNGGAIYVYGESNSLTNVEIDDSSALSVNMNACGGAIYWKGKAGTLINATISNTLANGRGGAIYWSGGSPKVSNISIEYSQTNVTNSTNDASGGAIYSTSIGDLKNVTIKNALASTESGNIYGGAIYYNGNTMDNVTVIGSCATTDDGESYGGAVYWKKVNNNAYVYNSYFEENNADFGGGIYFAGETARIYDTNFTGNVANKDGGAIYGTGNDVLLYRSILDHNSAKRGGAVFMNTNQIKVYDSTLEFNTAEEKGGAIYRTATSGSSEIKNSELINNTAFQGSAIYTGAFFALTNTVLLDNQANSNKFIMKTVGVDEDGKNYTSAVFVGYDNILNAIWAESDYIGSACSNVTYWDANGITVSNSKPRKSDCEAGQNITVEMYDHNGEFITSAVVVTDEDGAFKYIFDAEEGETYYFAYIHESDRYYTYLRDTLSNSSIVRIWVNDFYYGNSTSVIITLTDGAWGALSGNVTVTFNDTNHTNFTVEVINGTYSQNYTFNLPIGLYNASANYPGNLTRLAANNSDIFRVIPYDDLAITKTVNVTEDYVNVSEIIKYTITVVNNGPSAASGVNVTEILSPYLKLIKNETDVGDYSGTVWHIGYLDVNKPVNMTITAQIIHRGPITNTVWVESDGFDTNSSNDIDSARNFTALPIVDLRIVKEINATTDTINVTNIIKYTITVFNDGPSNATGIVVGEVLDYRLRMISFNESVGTYADGTWNIPRLNNGTNATLTIIAEVIYSGNITNVVNVTSYENDTNMSNNYYNITNLAIAYVDLQINKTVNVTGFVNVTDKIKFTIQVYNAGPANATGVYVSEILSPHLHMTYSNVTIGEYDGATWVIGNLNKGIVHNLTIIAEVISAGNISNAVNITGQDNDTNMSNNNDSIENITALPIVDLVITKDVNVSGFVNVTDKIKFTITVHNNGPCDATDVNVTEELSPHLKLISATTNNHGNYLQKQGYWYIGDLANQSTAILTLVCEVSSNGTIGNVVVVTSYENDTNKSNNNDSIENITALPVVDLVITKDVNVSGFVNVTDKIKFTITVHNNGPCDASDVNVSEVISPHLNVTSVETNGYGYYIQDKGYWYIGDLANQSTAVLTLYCQVISVGNIGNVVSVTSYENDTNKSNNNDSIENITALPIVDVSITKTVNVTSKTLNLTDRIEFTITIHNSGPCNATGVYVSEILDPALKLINYTATKGTYDKSSWGNISTLNVGDTEILIIIAEVQYSGIIENEVIVYSIENDTNITNNHDNISAINVTTDVDLEISKTVNVTTGYVNVTDLIEFTIIVHNKSPNPASGVYVSEILDSHLKLDSYNATKGTYADATWNIGYMDGGETVNLTIVARVISNGTIANAVVVYVWDNDTDPSNNNASIDNITALPIVDLQISKVVDVQGRYVNVSDIIQFTIDVFNNGPCDATNVTVSEVLSPHLKMITCLNSTGYYNVTEGIWHVGYLPNQSGAQLIIQARVISAGNISNVVVVSSNENDTNKSNNKDNITNITALPIVDLEVHKTSNVTYSGVVYVNNKIEYTITVRNNGPCDATLVNVTEILGNNIKLICNLTDYGNYTDGVWYIGNLTNQSTATLTIVAKVVGSGTVYNRVDATSYENDTNIYNNWADVSISALPVVDVSIVKTVNVTSPVYVSDEIEFTITVHNDGPCDATGVYVNETLNSNLKLVSNSTSVGGYDGSVWYIGDLANQSTVTLTIVAKVVSNGTITNVVVVVSNENDTNNSNNNDSIPEIEALPIVDVSVVKTVNVTGPVNVLDEIEFTITVHNDGPCDATGVYVNETLNSNLKLVSNSTSVGGYDGSVWYIGDLANQSTVTLTIVAKVVSNGTITNVVVVVPNENDTNKSNNNDSIPEIEALPIVDVCVNKTVNVTHANLGDNICYTITVHNYGPSDATDVNVTEKLSNYVSFVKANATQGSYDAIENIWHIGKLSNGSTQTLTLIVKIVKSETIENTVVVTSKENDTNLTNNNYTCENVTIGKINTPIDLYTYNITYGDDEILIITLPTNATGTVNVTVGNRNYPDVPINNGIVELPVYDLGGGDYTVDVTYGGDEKYLPNSTSGIFNVAPVTPIITIEVEDIWVGEVEVLNVTVNAPGTVFVTVNGRTVEIPLENGVVTTGLLAANTKISYKGNATWNIWGLPVGPYPAFALYPGNENYTSVNTTDLFHVRDKPSTVVVTAKDIYVGQKAVIHITVGPKGATGNVTVTLEGKTYNLKVVDGKATLVVSGLKAGTKYVEVVYNGNVLYRPSENSTTFKVLKLKPPVDIDAPEITVGEDGIIKVSVPEDATGEITIEVAGRRYTQPINDGVAIFVVPGLKVGVHDIKAFYSGDDKYLPADNAGSIKVNPTDDNKNDTPKVINKRPGSILLSDYPTGNPVWMLLVICMAIGSIPLRRFKK